MKNIFRTAFFLLAFTVVSCGGKETKNDEVTTTDEQTQTESSQEINQEESVPASQRVTLENKGVGKITSITIPETIDAKMVDKGKEVFSQSCTACHKTDQKFIGPALKGILERRSPEWVMNMILNPEVMLEKDPIAKDLLTEHNGSPMANQNLTEDQARNILEYLRSL